MGAGVRHPDQASGVTVRRREVPIEKKKAVLLLLLVSLYVCLSLSLRLRPLCLRLEMPLGKEMLLVVDATDQGGRAMAVVELKAGAVEPGRSGSNVKGAVSLGR